jgi:XRE family transcriptional regulator, regulator of sulfur utilization
VQTIPQYRRVLGEAIRINRKTAGLSQEKLAEKAELHPKYLSEVERGQKTISMDALMRITKALKVRLRELVRDI